MATNRKKAKKVSWQSEVNLCDVRYFSSEECPEKVGLGVNVVSIANINKKSVFSIPCVKWKCPVKIEMKPIWLISKAENSHEVRVQKERELMVFEVVYPRVTDIPRNPADAVCNDGFLVDQALISLIPITQIEDDEVVGESSLLNNVPDSQQSEYVDSVQSVSTVQNAGGIGEADIGVAASAALTVLLKSNEIGSSIDTNILIDILNNPETVNMLLNRTSSCVSMESAPKLISEQPTVIRAKAAALDSQPSSFGVPVLTTSPIPLFRVDSQYNLIHDASSQTTSNVIKPRIGSSVVTATLAPLTIAPMLGHLTQVKDANYYKNLIKKHGSDKKNFPGITPPHTQQSSHESAKYNMEL